MTAVLDRASTTEEGCELGDYNYEEMRMSAINQWKYEIIDTISKYDNLRYYTPFNDSNEVVYVQVVHPMTSELMNMEELYRLYEGMK